MGWKTFEIVRSIVCFFSANLAVLVYCIKQTLTNCVLAFYFIDLDYVIM